MTATGPTPPDGPSWARHRIAPPAARDGSVSPVDAVQAHRWGVTLWSADPASDVGASVRVSRVVLVDPRGPIALAWDAAQDLRRRPAPSRRVARALPLDVTARGVRAAYGALLVVLVAAVALAQPWALLAGLVLVPAALVLPDRLPGEHPAAWRREGHLTATREPDPAYDVADWLTTVGVGEASVGDQVTETVRLVVWECRDDEPDDAGSSRRARWLGDVATAVDLAAEIGDLAAASDDPAAAGRVVQLVPGGFRSLASERDHERAAAVTALGRLRDRLAATTDGHGSED